MLEPDVVLAETVSSPWESSWKLIGIRPARVSRSPSRWSRRPSAEPGLPASALAIWLLSWAMSVKSPLAVVTPAEAWESAEACTCARFWSIC